MRGHVATPPPRRQRRDALSHVTSRALSFARKEHATATPREMTRAHAHIQRFTPNSLPGFVSTHISICQYHAYRPDGDIRRTPPHCRVGIAGAFPAASFSGRYQPARFQLSAWRFAAKYLITLLRYRRRAEAFAGTSDDHDSRQCFSIDFITVFQLRRHIPPIPIWLTATHECFFNIPKI